jgi:hypothetical protein
MRVTRVVEDALWESNMYMVVAVCIVAILNALSVWNWVIGLFVASVWIFSGYYKDKAVKKAVDKLI